MYAKVGSQQKFWQILYLVHPPTATDRGKFFFVGLMTVCHITVCHFKFVRKIVQLSSNFLTFRILTLVPYEPSLINEDLLSSKQVYCF